MMQESRKVEIIGQYGATLSLIEVGLGSLLHSLHIPLAGKFLSLNQGYLLCRLSLASAETKERWLSYSVSNVAAVLKSLAPAGQKLGPMLSLSMQGLLFNLGVILAGTNPLGLSLGMILLSLWSFVQPLITYYLFFGSELFNAGQFLYQKTLPWHQLRPEHLGWILAGLIILKAIVAVLLALLACFKPASQKTLTLPMVKPRPLVATATHSPLVMALKDLTHPLFLSSLILTALFLFYSQHSATQIIGYLLRPLAIGLIFFYCSRTLTLDRWLERMQDGPLRVFARGCQVALLKLRKLG
jgi:hypothetical protein